MTIGIVWPDSGNITSICDALDRLGRGYRRLREPDLSGIDRLLLPGQGRFGPVMAFLTRSGWDAELRRWFAQDRPLIGICVGMQVMFESSDEDPEVPGLALLPGRITKLSAPKVPMIGWARIDWLVAGYPAGAAYFVNSFGLVSHAQSIASVAYGARFCAAVRQGRLIGCQFHPEKSGAMGKELLRRCLLY